MLERGDSLSKDKGKIWQGCVAGVVNTGVHARRKVCLGELLADCLAEVWIQSCRQWGALKVFFEGAMPLVLCFECGLWAVWRLI